MAVVNLTGSLILAGRTVTSVRPKLLDVIPGGLLACSLYLLSSAYSGPTFNLRRSTDNVTQDFYSNEIGFPFAAVAAFLGSATGFVTKLYDQTGIGAGLSQATASKQPVLQIANGQPEIAFTSGTQQSLSGSYIVPASITLMGRFRATVSSLSGQPVTSWLSATTANNDTSITPTSTNRAQIIQKSATGTISYVNSAPVANLMAFNSVASVFDGGAGAGFEFLNGSQANTGTSSGRTSGNSQGLTMGGSGNASGTGDASFTHAVVWSSALTSDQVSQADAIMKFVGSFPTVSSGSVKTGSRILGAQLPQAALSGATKLVAMEKGTTTALAFVSGRMSLINRISAVSTCSSAIAGRLSMAAGFKSISSARALLVGAFQSALLVKGDESFSQYLRGSLNLKTLAVGRLNRDKKTTFSDVIDPDEIITSVSTGEKTKP